uniref:hepatitis A virus cellular receptor 1 homolog n=1 Tax=Myodes glareolus TaxID=447135 RepID=UPI00202215D7|nr:hepatitis A virus cellular receptor 1 homolog [Myodes glareolus]
MTHLQVFIPGLILLLPAAVESVLEVRGVVGHPVTLPCTYPVSRGISPVCWGRLARFSDQCKDGIILTNGYNISYKRNKRYHLKGPLLQGNVSLTIETVTESDSGFYCCRVEMKEWNAVLIVSLTVHTESDPAQNPPTIMTRRFYIGISITLLFFLLASTAVITKCILMKRKSGSRSLVALRVCRTGTLQNIESRRPRAQENIYIIEDGPPVRD